VNRFFVSALIALSTLTLSFGCEDKSMNPEDELAPNSFEATISGAVNLNVKGCASYIGQTGFFLLGLNPTEPANNGALLSLARESSSVPAVGTYQISEDAASASSRDFIGLFAYTEGQSSDTYISQSGTLTVTASASDSFKGRFDFTATMDTKTVTVSGEFHATSSFCR